MSEPEDAPHVVRALRLGWYWRKGAQNHLYLQSRRWYELLILGQDPSTLIRPYELVRNWKASLRAFQALWVPLVTAAASLALIVALVTLSIEGSATPFLKALFGVLAAAGARLPRRVVAAEVSKRTLTTTVGASLP